MAIAFHSHKEDDQAQHHQNDDRDSDQPHTVEALTVTLNSRFLEAFSPSTPTATSSRPPGPDQKE